MAKKAKKPEQDQAAGANETAAAVQDQPQTESGGADDSGTTATPEAEEQLPHIGDIVHYFEREEIVHAADPVRQREPRPHAAIVTGVELFEGQNLLQLLECHPSEGPTVRRHVRFSPTPEAHTWTWRPIATLGKAPVARVPMEQLIEAVNIVIRKLHNEAADRLDVEAAGGQGAQPLDPPATDSSLATEGEKKTDAQA